MLVDSALFNVHLSSILPILCGCIFQPTAVVSASRQAMPVDGASTTKCAVVLHFPALMKLTGFRLVCGMTIRVLCVSGSSFCMAIMTNLVSRPAEWN